MDQANHNRGWHQRIMLSWQLMSEVGRRHPAGHIVQGYAHQGYDCLIFHFDPALQTQQLLAVRNGSIHVDGIMDRPAQGWSEVAMLGARNTAKTLEDALGVSGPAATPATTPRTLVYRTLSAICSYSMANGVLLDPRSGLYSDDDDEGTNTGFFRSFARARTHLSKQSPSRDFDARHPAARYWFLIPHLESGSIDDHWDWMKAEPVAAFHESGAMWLPDNRHIDLVELYDHVGRSFTRYLKPVIGELPTYADD